MLHSFLNEDQLSGFINFIRQRRTSKDRNHSFECYYDIVISDIHLVHAFIVHLTSQWQMPRNRFAVRINGVKGYYCFRSCCVVVLDTEKVLNVLLLALRSKLQLYFLR